MAIYDKAILEAALVGLTLKKTEVEKMIEELRGVRRPSTKSVAAAPKPPVKRLMSKEARKRIADAQKKRWEAYREAKGAA
jgi:hypothetical protein